MRCDTKTTIGRREIDDIFIYYFRYVEKFIDFMVNDVVIKDCFCVDYLFEEVVEELLCDLMLKVDRRRELEDL